MTDLYDIPPAERTREDVRAHYYKTFPLLRAYEEITEKLNSVSNPDINDPATSPTAVDTVAAAALALERVGRLPRDREDALHAERYIRALQEEMREQFPATDPSIIDLVIRGIYGLAGCMPTAEDWVRYDEETAEFELDEIMHGAPDHTDVLKALLREALRYAMPAVLREITARYGRGRHLSAVKDDGKGTHLAHAPDGERCYSPAEAAALLWAAAEGGPLPGEAFDLGDRVTVLPVEPCALCGEPLSVRTGTVTRLPDDENRFEVELDDPVGVHLFGDGAQRCGSTTRSVLYRADELELIDDTDADNEEAHNGPR